MSYRLVYEDWGAELVGAVRRDSSALQIICPFIKVRALDRLLDFQPAKVRVLTQFNLAHYAEGVSDIDALRRLLDVGAQVRGIRNLHAKLYLFGKSSAIITSANLTISALGPNHEFGLVAEDTEIVNICGRYFENLWSCGGKDLTVDQVEDWDQKVLRCRALGAQPSERMRLGDFGANAGFDDPLSVALADAPNSFVKFLGDSRNRVSRSRSVLDVIKDAGCHWALAYPASRRPRGVQDGTVLYIGRLTKDPNDILIFGRAFGMKHQPGRDDATPADIERRPWMQNWSRFVRVHHAEFVAGTIENGVSLNELMASLKADSFASTQHHVEIGQGNTDPRRAYRQQPAVELSPEGQAWLGERLQGAFHKHGKVPNDMLSSLDWPKP